MLEESRLKQLMKNAGMPNSLSLLHAFQQAVMEAEIAERKRCAAIAQKFEPDEKHPDVTYASDEILGWLSDR